MKGLRIFENPTQREIKLAVLYLFFVIVDACTNNSECASDEFCDPDTNKCRQNDNPPSSASSEERKSTGEILAAIIIPSAVAVILMCLCVYYCRREKKFSTSNRDAINLDDDSVAISLRVYKI